jgi:peroxiredoxin
MELTEVVSIPADAEQTRPRYCREQSWHEVGIFSDLRQTRITVRPATWAFRYIANCETCGVLQL